MRTQTEIKDDAEELIASWGDTYPEIKNPSLGYGEIGDMLLNQYGDEDLAKTFYALEEEWYECED